MTSAICKWNQYFHSHRQETTPWCWFEVKKGCNRPSIVLFFRFLGRLSFFPLFVISAKLENVCVLHRNCIFSFKLIDEESLLPEWTVYYWRFWSEFSCIYIILYLLRPAQKVFFVIIRSLKCFIHCLSDELWLLSLFFADATLVLCIKNAVSICLVNGSVSKPKVFHIYIRPAKS